MRKVALDQKHAQDTIRVLTPVGVVERGDSGPRKVRSVLLVVNHDAFARQMARWAHILKAHGAWEPILYIGAEHADRHMDGCRSEGIAVVSPMPEVAGERETGAKWSHVPSMRGQIVRKVLRHVPGLRSLADGCRKMDLPVRMPSQIAALRSRIRFVRHVIRERQISALLISESSPAYDAPAYIQAAHLENIPVATVPLEKATARHYAENYLNASHLSLDRPLNRLIGSLYPRWVIAYKGRRMVRVEPALLLALEWLGLGPSYPWQLVGNQEDIVAVDSQATFDHYLSEGVPAERMIVTGAAEHDISSQMLQETKRMRAELYHRLSLPAGRPMLLSPLVQEHYVAGRPECDFQEYAKMVEFWVRSLGVIENYNIVINLHPGHTYNQDPRSWDYIEQWGVKICHQDLATLIPLCDIYVAAGSSTIPWAIACGKPVVNYDVYRYGSPTYQSVPGVLTMQEQDEFCAVLKRLTSDPVFYSEIATLQACCAEYWGKVDGNAGRRMVQLLDRLVEYYQKGRP